MPSMNSTHAGPVRALAFAAGLLLPAACALAAEVAARAATPPGAAGSARALFEQRILPILNSAKPSSCAECHLSGVDLKDYLHASQEKTFAALRAAGLVDLKDPDRSKILTFIARKPEKPGLIPEQVRQQELEGFRAWLHAAVKDPALAKVRPSAAAAPAVDSSVIRHTRKDRILTSFEENIWLEMNRCVHCHSPEYNRKHIERLGKEFVDRITWIVPGDPRATMDRIVENGLVDLEAPEKSLILTKPAAQVEHRGGPKMVVGDRSYKQFRRFLTDYAASVQGRYRRASDLPAADPEVAVTSPIILRVEGLPSELGLKLLKADVHRWDESAGKWSADRWATAEWLINGRMRFWQFGLTLTAPRGSARARELSKKELPAGRYLVRLSIDRQGRLQKDPQSEWSEADRAGEVEIESRWAAGPQNRTVVAFPFPASAGR